MDIKSIFKHSLTNRAATHTVAALAQFETHVASLQIVRRSLSCRTLSLPGKLARQFPRSGCNSPLLAFLAVSFLPFLPGDALWLSANLLSIAHVLKSLTVKDYPIPISPPDCIVILFAILLGCASGFAGFLKYAAFIFFYRFLRCSLAAAHARKRASWIFVLSSTLYAALTLLLPASPANKALGEYLVVLIAFVMGIGGKRALRGFCAAIMLAALVKNFSPGALSAGFVMSVLFYAIRDMRRFIGVAALVLLVAPWAPAAARHIFEDIMRVSRQTGAGLLQGFAGMAESFAGAELFALAALLVFALVFYMEASRIIKQNKAFLNGLIAALGGTAAGLFVGGTAALYDFTLQLGFWTYLAVVVGGAEEEK